MDHFTCKNARDAASAHRDRKLRAADASRVDAHLRACADCRSAFARDARIAELARNRRSRVHPDAGQVARDVRRGLVEKALIESRRPAWQRGLRRMDRSLRPRLRALLRSRVTIGLLLLVALGAAYEAGRRGVPALTGSGAQEDAIDPEFDPEFDFEARPREGLPALQRLLRDFDAEDLFLQNILAELEPKSAVEPKANQPSEDRDVAASDASPSSSPALDAATPKDLDASSPGRPTSAPPAVRDAEDTARGAPATAEESASNELTLAPFPLPLPAENKVEPTLPVLPPQRAVTSLPESIRLVSARPRSSPKELRTDAELLELMKHLKGAHSFDVIIEAMTVKDGRTKRLRLRRRAGGPLEVLSLDSEDD